MDDVFKNLAALETDRLILRKLKSTDCHDIFDFTSLPEVCEFLSWEPHSSIAITQSFIESVLEKYKKNETAQWCIELKSTNVVIGLTGFISFSQEHLKGEIAYLSLIHI